MHENPKEKQDDTVEHDQKERGYYYDDAHGYETYEPEVDEEHEDGDVGCVELQPAKLTADDTDHADQEKSDRL